MPPIAGSPEMLRGLIFVLAFVMVIWLFPSILLEESLQVSSLDKILDIFFNWIHFFFNWLISLSYSTIVVGPSFQLLSWWARSFREITLFLDLVENTGPRSVERSELAFWIIAVIVLTFSCWSVGLQWTLPPLLLFALLVGGFLCLSEISIFKDHLEFLWDYVLIDAFKELI